jgi:hypothetical protein
MWSVLPTILFRGISNAVSHSFLCHFQSVWFVSYLFSLSRTSAFCSLCQRSYTKYLIKLNGRSLSFIRIVSLVGALYLTPALSVEVPFKGRDEWSWARKIGHRQYWLYRVFEEELYNGISNVSVWRVLRKRLHCLQRWIVCTLLSVNTRHTVTFGIQL